MVELEVEEKRSGIMLGPEDSPAGRREFTYRGYVLAAGPDAKGLKFGELVYIEPSVDLRPEVDVSQTNVSKMVPNPNAPYFTFRTDQRKFWSKNIMPKKQATVLLHDYQIYAKADEFVDV